MRGATVSDFFYKDSKSKKIIFIFILFIFFFDVGGGAVVCEGGYSKRISLNKNTKIQM